MNLLEKIDSDLTQAQKEKNEFLRDTLRYLKSALKYASINKQGELTEAEIISVVQKEVKQRKDAASQYKNANRPELATKEEDEILILEGYLPTQMSDEELKQIISQAITDSGATEVKDIGKVMSKIMPQIQGKADGSRVSAFVKELLNHE